jgi:ankyrin repeat protein
MDIVNFLIIKGSDPTLLTIDDFTPLQLTIVNQSLEIASTLL